ncbi:MAG: hypothetical protein LBB22_04595 [Treponema sp.]|nr:hypothetical protein [Treponema sp.]
MKKSLFLGVAALAFLLAFAACEQESSDDDSGGGGVIPSYQYELGGIAVAFADGAPVVYLKDNLKIGNGELVIPEGKELDLTDRGTSSATIDQFAPGGKIIVLGTIRFSEYTVNMVNTGAFIVARQDYIDANVNIVDSEGYELDKNKHILATANQIIPIQAIDLANGESWKSAIDFLEGESGPAVKSDYLVTAYSGEINNDIAEQINIYGKGRKLYIIGDVIFTGGVIDTIGARLYPEIDGALANSRNIISDRAGDFLIGGSAKFTGPIAEVSTGGAFTVLGILSTGEGRSDTPINRAGDFVSYVARLDGGGAFYGNTYFNGNLPSNLGVSVAFRKNLEVRGPVIINAIAFNGDATNTVKFFNTVEFKGENKDVTWGVVTTSFEGDVLLTSAKNPVDLSTKTGIKSLTYNNLYEGMPAGTLQGATYVMPVTFGAGFSVKGGPYEFRDNVTVNGIVTTSSDATVNGQFKVVGSEAVFKGGPFEFGTDAVFNGNVLFESPVVFASNVRFEKSVNFDDDVELVDPDKAVFNGKQDTTVVFGKSINNGSYNIHTINSNVNFSGDVSVGTKATFAGSTTVFKGEANFSDKVDFTGTGLDTTTPATPAVVFNKQARFTDYVSFEGGKAGVEFKGEVSLTTANNVGGSISTLYFNGPLTYTYPGQAGVITFAPYTKDARGTLAVDSLTLKNGELAVSTVKTGGAGTLANAKIGFVETGFVLNPSGLTDGSGLYFKKGELEFINYTIAGTTATDGYTEIIQANTSTPVRLSNDLITSTDTTAMGSLSFGGTPSILIKDNFTIKGLTLDFALGGTVSIPKTNRAAIAITLAGGTLVAGNETTGIAGVITASGSNKIVGGTLSSAVTGTALAPGGFILANGPSNTSTKYTGLLVGHGEDKAPTETAGSVSVLGKGVATLDGASVFRTFLVTGDNPATPEDAWNIVSDLIGSANFNLGGGSIAVFSSTASN